MNPSFNGFKRVVKTTTVAPPQPPQEAPRKAQPKSATRTDRLPPHAPEAEQGVLGCVLLSPNDCLNQCAEKLKAGAEVFYDLRHQEIYKALLDMQAERLPIDIISVQQKLKDKQLLDEIGGIPYLNSLQDSVPSAANLSYYLEIVEEKAVLRNLIKTCTEAVGKAYKFDGEVDALLDEVERDVLKISEARQQTENDEEIKGLVRKSISHIEVLFESKGKITGVPTGFVDLDQMTDGMHGGDMIVLAGYPSTGKTSLAMNIAEHVLLVHHLPVAVFTYEMSPESLVTRFICSHARVNLRNVRQGYLSESDFPKLTNTAGKVSASKMHIVKASGLSVGQLRAKARRLHQQHGIKLAVIDYLQKIPADGRVDKRSDAVALVSNGVKDLAMELNIPVLILSQLNADGGLFMSSETGMDADTLMKLRVDKSGEEWANSDGVPVALDIEKQRNGPTGTVPLTFLRPYTRFESAAKVSDEDLPAAATDDQRNPHND